MQSFLTVIVVFGATILLQACGASSGNDSSTEIETDKVSVETQTPSETETSENVTPIANNQTITVEEDDSGVITLTGNDIDEDELIFSLISNPKNGIVTGTAPNLTYTPTANFHGSDHFDFRISDGQGDSAAATVNIVITEVNDAPTANNQTITVEEDDSGVITLTGNDIDEDELIFSLISNPENGIVTGTAPNLTYTPTANFHGSDHFDFRISDGQGDSAVATVNIVITEVNDAPTANNQTITVEEGGSEVITLTGNDIDEDELVFSLISTPENGIVTGTAPNLTYTPTANFHGSDRFNVQVADGKGGLAIGTISITVTAPPKRSDITVMGYNIMMLPAIAGDWDQNQRADHLASALRTMDSLPDVIGYSEVLDDYSYSTITAIKEYPYATPVGGLVCSEGKWDSISGPCSNAPTIVRGGIMISSQHPIDEQHALIFSSVTNGSPDAYANKGAVYAKVDISGFKYHIIATHFQATHDSGDDDEHLVRTDQMAEIKDWIDSLDIPRNEPVILTGDFNVPFSKTSQVSDMLSAGNTILNFPNNEGFGSYPYDNLMSKAFVFYYDDDVCYDDTLDYVMHRSDYLQPVSAPEVDVVALKSPVNFYWSYLDKDWVGCDGATVARDGYTTDISDHYPVVTTYQYPTEPAVAPVEVTNDVIALKKSDSRSTASLVPADNYYSYFRNAESFPFESDATEHSWINAFWLSDASLLAYSSPDFIEKQTAAAGLMEFEFYESDSSQCFIANNEEFAIFSCRGTEPTTYADYLTDINYQKVDAENNGQVHQGFKDALDAVWAPASSRLTALKADGVKLWFAGHSLGGAMVHIAADRMCLSESDCGVSGLYTVGTPAVGDEDFGNNFYAPYYRTVYYQDPVPRLLGSVLGFKHAPSDVYYFDYSGHYTGQQTYPTTPTPNMVYHAPFYYAVYSWNNYVESLKPKGGVVSSSTIVDTRAEGVIIDNISQDYAETGTWETATSGEYQGDDYRLSIDSAAKASWSFNVSEAGSYEIFFKAPGAFGFSDTYYGSDATVFSLYQGETKLTSIAADLYNTAYDFTSMGLIELNPDKTYSVVIKGAYTGSSEYAISADAIKVVYNRGDVGQISCVDDALCIDPTQGEIILDNDNSGADHYSEMGSGWVDKAMDSANNGNYRYSANPSAQGRWAFKVAETGAYKISFKSPGGFSWGHGYGSDQVIYRLKEGDAELATTNSGNIDLYNNAYDFGDIDIATVTLVQGESYTVSVSGAYATTYSYGIAADAIKIIHQVD